MSGMGEKTSSALSGATKKLKIDGDTMDSVSEKISGVGEKLKGTVKGVPESTDELSNKIDLFLEERKDQIIKDWELATKDDILDLEKRYKMISVSTDELGSSFNDYREDTNKKLKKLEERLERLENLDE